MLIVWNELHIAEFERGDKPRELSQAATTGCPSNSQRSKHQALFSADATNQSNSTSRRNRMKLCLDGRASTVANTLTRLTTGKSISHLKYIELPDKEHQPIKRMKLYLGEQHQLGNTGIGSVGPFRCLAVDRASAVANRAVSMMIAVHVRATQPPAT